MPEQEAIEKYEKLLGRRGITQISPIAREIKQSADTTTFRNVVLIFMESMSANLMESFGSNKNLTPFLDSLYHQSLSSAIFIHRASTPIMACTLLCIHFLPL